MGVRVVGVSVARAGLAMGALLVAGGLALAESSSHVGNFELQFDKDRFEGRDSVIAEVARANSALLVRCLRGSLDIAYGEFSFGTGRWDEGMEAKFRVKVDSGPVTDLDASGINDKLIASTDNVEDVVRAMIGARELAIRVEAKGITFDQVFVLRQSAKAIPIVLKACGGPRTAPAPTNAQEAPAASAPQNPSPPMGVVMPEAANPPTVSNPPSAAAGGTGSLDAKATLHLGLSTEDRERMERVIPAYIAAGMCNGSVSAAALADEIAKTGDAGTPVFSSLAIEEALAALRSRELETAHLVTLRQNGVFAKRPNQIMARAAL